MPATVARPFVSSPPLSEATSLTLDPAGVNQGSRRAALSTGRRRDRSHVAPTCSVESPSAACVLVEVPHRTTQGRGQRGESA